ncbi:putative porin [Alkalimonas sp.]|uniref:putative porin n=1 Tax=Alkalimonas sp. TaxID=1872453 RepID=UPI00263A9552|nr:putative porin [Alkalimonas sp.]MCC5826822.1 putative porin [Alkalimonas sp.]
MKTTFASLSLLCCASLMAEPFTSELSLDRFDTNYDVFTSHTLGYRYFVPGAERQQPLPYAAYTTFAGRSSVSANYMVTDFSWRYFGLDYSERFKAWQVGGIYQSNEHNLYASLQHSQMISGSGNRTQGKLGYYVQDNWLVTVDVEHEKFSGGSNYWHTGISTEKLWALHNGHFIGFDFGYLRARGPRRDGWDLGVDYYIGKPLSFGVFATRDRESHYLVSTNRLGVRSQWFITPSIQLRGSLSLEDKSDSEYAWDLGVSWRF